MRYKYSVIIGGTILSLALVVGATNRPQKEINKRVSTVSLKEKAAAVADGQTSGEGDGSMQTTDYLSIPFKTIAGHDSSLADFHGHVVLIVNVASRCGFTP